MPGSIPLGYRPETREPLYLADADRFSGTYIIGVQGSGKSGEIQNMAHADIEAGNAVIVIDPHGDLVDDVIAQLPASRIHETYVLDMNDEEYPFGVNLFSQGKLTTEAQRAVVTNRIAYLFKMLWPEVEGQQYLPTILHMATVALLSYEGATLGHLYQLLVDDSFRAKVLSNPGIDQSVKRWWQLEYDKLGSKRDTVIAPLTRRLHMIITGRPLVSNIVTQPRTTISFRRAIENREVILIKLPIKGMKDEASFVGKLIGAQLAAAVFSFGDLPPERRPGVSIYVDEFSHFAIPDFAEIFSEGRKFGVKVTLAHQWRTQLPEYIREATKTARNKIVFQLGADDAKEMAHYFPNHGGGRLERVDPNPVKTLLMSVINDHNVREFVEVYLRPLHVRRFDGASVVEVEKPGFDWGNMAVHGLRGYKSHEKTIYVDDPRPYLDVMFREVMEAGDPNYWVPQVVVGGLCNGGKGFYKLALKAKRGVDINMSIPGNNVINGRWVVDPRNSDEQFYHFIWHLRATLRYLAANPLGTFSENKQGDVARQLTELPRRTALVRSGDTVAKVMTYDTPLKVTGQELMSRVSALQHQTHLKYCHPRPQVVQQVVESANDPVGAGESISGWGELNDP